MNLRTWINMQLANLPAPSLDDTATPENAAIVTELKHRTAAAGLYELSLSLPIEDCKYPVSVFAQLNRVLAALETPTPPTNGADMSVAQVAALLGVSKETVYKLCAEGDLSHNRIGTRITITPDQLAEYRQLQAR
jgi:excisionase family DNA binding protein